MSAITYPHDFRVVERKGNGTRRMACVRCGKPRPKRPASPVYAETCPVQPEWERTRAREVTGR